MIMCIAKEKKEGRTLGRTLLQLIIVTFIQKLKQYVIKHIFLKNRLLIGISAFLGVPRFKPANC